MLVRAMTQVPGIVDEPLPHQTHGHDVREVSPQGPGQRPHSYQQINREDESVSHHSEAYLVSNMPDPIVPNRSRQLSDSELNVNEPNE